MSEHFPPTALQRQHAPTIRDISSSYVIDYVIVIKNFQNPKKHQNPINGSKVTVILLKGWILPIGGASAVDGLRSTGLLCLVLFDPPPLKKNLHHSKQLLKINKQSE